MQAQHSCCLSQPTLNTHECWLWRQQGAEQQNHVAWIQVVKVQPKKAVDHTEALFAQALQVSQSKPHLLFIATTHRPVHKTSCSANSNIWRSQGPMRTLCALLSFNACLPSSPFSSCIVDSVLQSPLSTPAATMVRRSRPIWWGAGVNRGRNGETNLFVDVKTITNDLYLAVERWVAISKHCVKTFIKIHKFRISCYTQLSKRIALNTHSSGMTNQKVIGASDSSAVHWYPDRHVVHSTCILGRHLCISGHSVVISPMVLSRISRVATAGFFPTRFLAQMSQHYQCCSWIIHKDMLLTFCL